VANERTGFDGVSRFIGFQWEAPDRVRMTIRPEHINRAGLLSGPVTYALIDYCMGSTLWAERSEEERIATVTIAINYVRTATEGDIVCNTTLDRRNDRVAVLSSHVHHTDGTLVATAIGTYSIFPAKRLADLEPASDGLAPR
jgi:uncharacterized protein (TIGR00369 family)